MLKSKTKTLPLQFNHEMEDIIAVTEYVIHPEYNNALENATEEDYFDAAFLQLEKPPSEKWFNVKIIDVEKCTNVNKKMMISFVFAFCVIVCVCVCTAAR